MKKNTWKKWMATSMATLMAVGCLQLGTANVHADSKEPTAAAYTTDGDSDFQSTAEAAKANAKLGTDFIEREEEDSTHVIKSSVTYTKTKVTVSKAKGEDKVYLYVQGNINGTDWVYSKAIASEEITASDIQKANDLEEAPDLSDCKIWLEKQFDDGLYIVNAAKASANDADAQNVKPAAKDEDDEDMDDGFDEDADDDADDDDEDYDDEDDDDDDEDDDDEDAFRISAPDDCTVKVNGQTASSAEEDDDITITANNTPAGGKTYKWTVKTDDDTEYMYGKAISFTMGDSDVKVTKDVVDTYSLTVNNGSSDRYSYAAGETVTICADDDDDSFDKWNTEDGDVNFSDEDSRETSFVMPAHDVTVEASYIDVPEEETYTVDVENGACDQESYEAGDTVFIEADPAEEEQHFANWTSEDGVDFDNASAESTTFIMPDHDVTVTATYEADPVKYNVTVDNGSCDQADYAAGDTVIISADAAPEGEHFESWTTEDQDVDIDDASSSSTTFIMPDHDVAVAAAYEQDAITYAVTVEHGSADSTDYKPGETVNITATDGAAGMHFTGWTTDDKDVTFASANKENTSFIMPDHEVTVTANYAQDEQITYTVTVEHGSAEYTDYAPGDTVNIAATDGAAGMKFTGWTTDDKDVTFASANSEKTSFTMPDHEVTVTANYTQIPADTYTVTVTNGTTSAATAKAGDTVTITANAAPDGKEFAGWTSDDVTIKLPMEEKTSFTMPAKNVTVTANYTAKTVAVTGVTLNHSSLTYSKTNLSYQLTATVAPENATNKDVTWSSSDTNVATVSDTGVVTSKAKGECTITVTTKDGGKTASCKVTVTSNTAAKSSSDGTIQATNVKTGDASPIMTYVTILGIAAAALVVLLVAYLRKRRNRD